MAIFLLRFLFLNHFNHVSFALKHLIAFKIHEKLQCQMQIFLDHLLRDNRICLTLTGIGRSVLYFHGISVWFFFNFSFFLNIILLFINNIDECKINEINSSLLVFFLFQFKFWTIFMLFNVVSNFTLHFVFSTFCVFTQNINKLYNECTKQDCLIIKTFVKMPDQFA